MDKCGWIGPRAVSRRSRIVPGARPPLSPRGRPTCLTPPPTDAISTRNPLCMATAPLPDAAAPGHDPPCPSPAPAPTPIAFCARRFEHHGCISAPLPLAFEIPIHEFGHFKGQDTKFSERFYPIYRGTAASLAALQAAAGEGSGSIPLLPALAVFSCFLECFSIAESRLSRERSSSMKKRPVQSPVSLL